MEDDELKFKLDGVSRNMICLPVLAPLTVVTLSRIRRLDHGGRSAFLNLSIERMLNGLSSS